MEGHLEGGGRCMGGMRVGGEGEEGKERQEAWWRGTR